MKLLTVWCWLYAVIGTVYFALYEAGADIVTRYAVGPLWVLMVTAPIALFILVLLPVLRKMAAATCVGAEENATRKKTRILQRTRDIGL
ncbi:MAG TPA: hypothetical protein VF450_04575 [Noviherbaspirillum sp.]